MLRKLIGDVKKNIINIRILTRYEIIGGKSADYVFIDLTADSELASMTKEIPSDN